MNSKSAKLIKRYVKNATENELKQLGLSVYQVISNPYKYVKNIYKSLPRVRRNHFKQKLI